MVARNPVDIIETFRSLNRMAVDAEGIRTPHAVWQVNGGFHVAALAMSGPTGSFDTYAAIGRALVRYRPDELVFGLDRFTKPGQGVETADCLSVSHWDGRAWRFGVIAYQHKPARFDPVDWDNAFWRDALFREMTSCWGNIVNAPHREPSPAMALPIAVRASEVKR